MSVGHAFAALGVGVAGSVITYYMVTAQSGPITCILVSEMQSIPADYNSKIGSEYKDFLVSTKDFQNKKWWEESYIRWKQDAETKNADDLLGDEFKSGKITMGFDGTNDKALNFVCEKIYQQDTSQIQGNNGNAKRKNSLWKYCSPVGKVPKRLQEDAERQVATNTLGKENESTVLSTEHVDNVLVWEFKDKVFFRKGATAPEVKHKFFKAFYDSEMNKEKKASLKDKCAEAYKITKVSSGTNDNPSSEEIVKYCSLLGK